MDRMNEIIELLNKYAYEYYTLVHLQKRLQLSTLFSYEYEPLYFFSIFISTSVNLKPP